MTLGRAVVSAAKDLDVASVPATAPTELAMNSRREDMGEFSVDGSHAVNQSAEPVSNGKV